MYEQYRTQQLLYIICADRKCSAASEASRLLDFQLLMQEMLYSHFNMGMCQV
jgi:hypothetical protein